MKPYTIHHHADILPIPPAGYKWKRTKNGEKIQKGVFTYPTISGLKYDTTQYRDIGWDYNPKALNGNKSLFWYLVRDKSIPLYNHMFDLAATIETPHEDFDKIPIPDLIAVMRKRLDYLEKNPNECAEAFGFCDSYKVPK